MGNYYKKKRGNYYGSCIELKQIFVYKYPSLDVSVFFKDDRSVRKLTPILMLKDTGIQVIKKKKVKNYFVENIMYEYIVDGVKYEIDLTSKQFSSKPNYYLLWILREGKDVAMWDVPSDLLEFCITDECKNILRHYIDSRVEIER